MGSVTGRSRPNLPTKRLVSDAKGAVFQFARRKELTRCVTWLFHRRTCRFANRRIRQVQAASLRQSAHTPDVST
jgi:hypothetical protein